MHGGGGGGLKHNRVMQFFTLDGSKIELFETCFLDIVITSNDHPRYVKHVSGRIYVFFTVFGDWVRGGHNLLMRSFAVASSKIEVSETYFSDTVIT